MKTSLIALCLLSPLAALPAQSAAWNKSPNYIRVAEQASSSATLHLAASPLLMPPVATVNAESTPLTLPQNVLIRYFSTDNVEALRAILYDPDDIKHFDDASLAATVKQRNLESKVWIESVLEFTQKGATYAAIKFYIDDNTLPEPVYGIHVARKRGKEYFLAPFQAGRVAIAFLNVNTLLFSEALAGTSDLDLPFLKGGVLDLELFVYTVDLWGIDDSGTEYPMLQDPER